MTKRHLQQIPLVSSVFFEMKKVLITSPCATFHSTFIFMSRNCNYDENKFPFLYAVLEYATGLQTAVFPMFIKSSGQRGLLSPER